MNQVRKLAYWINEREKIRLAKEVGKPKPWTRDKILQRYKFTNVHREDDRVTKWIAEHWRDPHKNDKQLWHAMLIARFLNWPDTLKEMGWPEPWWRMSGVCTDRLRARRDRGEKVYTGAYIVSTNGVDMDKLEYSIELFDVTAGTSIPATTLHDTWKYLVALNKTGSGTASGNHGGVGSFMAAQIVADLKHTPILARAPDWWDWAAPGPGSLRGLLAVRGGSVNDFKAPAKFVAELLKLRKELEPMLGKYVSRLCLQDLQNCLCEFSKYTRGYCRSRYPGEA